MVAMAPRLDARSLFFLLPSAAECLYLFGARPQDMPESF
jgi:hypothetical protein